MLSGVLNSDIAIDTNIYIMLAGKLSIGDIVYPVELTESLEENGIVTGTLLKETISPVGLFFGS